MKLRIKFSFLIIAIIVVPIIMTLFIGHFYAIAIMQDKEIANNTRKLRWMMGTMHKRNEGKSLNDITQTIPEGINLIILDPGNKVLFSNFNNKTGDVLVEPEDLIAQLTHDYPDHTVLYDPIFLKGYEEAKIFIIIRRDAEKLISPFLAFRWIIPLFFFFLVVSIFIGVLILTTFRKSFIKLEEATKKIARGDLDFNLTPRGNDEIASLTRSFNSMRIKLKEELAKRSRFLMAVSHDLSTPLTSIKGYLEAITDGFAGDKENLKKYISIICDKSEILQNRIEELIEFVRLETGGWQLKQETIRLLEFLKQTTAIYKEDAVIFKRRFIHDIDIPENIRVTIDQSLLLRALENLFHNAVRYTQENDEIRFSAKSLTENIQLTIEDTGSGIEEYELTHIFDPFFRGKKFNKTRGFGLGLSTVKSIINAHGWNIDVQSKPGKGTTFIISIKIFQTE